MKSDCCNCTLVPSQNSNDDVFCVITIPAPAAVLTVTEKAPVVTFCIWKRATALGTTTVLLPVNTPDRYTMPVLSCAAVNAMLPDPAMFTEPVP
ncbi:hypothetical protein D9M71_793410 [compost metagenome]